MNNVYTLLYIEKAVDVARYEIIKILKEVRFESAHFSECKSKLYYAESSENQLTYRTSNNYIRNSWADAWNEMCSARL